MADDLYVITKVECPRCKTKQKVHVAARTDSHRWATRRFNASGATIISRQQFPIGLFAGRSRRRW
jgi:hypothetical protein